MVFDLVQHLGDLVDHPAVRRLPGAPLMAVHRTQVSVLIGPFVPDGDAVVLQELDVGVSGEEPQELVDDGTRTDKCWHSDSVTVNGSCLPASASTRM